MPSPLLREPTARVLGAGDATAPPDAIPLVRGPELAVLVPTFNERDNIEPLLARLRAALLGIEWEVVFVDDDSPDGTAAQIRLLAQADPRIRCLQRIGRRGLSTAVIEGMLASSAPYLAVIDADLQHDETLLPRMLDTLKAEGLDLVIGSRHVAGGGVGDWDRHRVTMSGIAARLARLITAAELTDPMSGFFMVSRPAFESALRRLSGQGFKILLDLFASTPVAFRFKEIPYVFGRRLHGESKLDSLVVWEYLMLLLDKLIGGYVPVRFVFFAAVGTSGIAVHFHLVFRMEASELSCRAGAGNRDCNDQQLRAQQHADLPRPAAHRHPILRRSLVVLCDLRLSERWPMSASPRRPSRSTTPGGPQASPAPRSASSGITPSRRSSPGIAGDRRRHIGPR
jgi:dolichol-phosphate mannosyltransferase